MYVRSYGDKPKITQRDPLASPSLNPQADGTPTVADQTETPSPSAAPQEAPVSETVVQDRDRTATEENGASTPTELYAIPRQPIRRRKIVRKQTEDRCTALEEEEQKCPEHLPCIEERNTHTACDESVCPDHRDKNTENRSTLPPNALSCGHTPQREQCKSEKAERKNCGAFSTEEMLLGGLIILLMNDGASDDILIILAFLLVSGFSLQ